MINQLEEVRNARRWGNSGGVSLPKSWIGKQVKVILIDRSDEIKKEVLNILSSDLEDIQGIYLTGSYARNEQKEDSDIDIIAISNNTKKVISSGRFSIQIYTIQGVKNTLKNYPISLLPSLIEAKTILNKQLLEELNKTKVTKKSFAGYLEECKRVLNINKKILETSKIGNYSAHSNVIYSAFLRLRGIYLMGSILENKKKSKKDFYNWIISSTNIDSQNMKKAVQIYKEVRDKKKVDTRIDIKITNALLKLIETELSKYDKT